MRCVLISDEPKSSRTSARRTSGTDCRPVRGPKRQRLWTTRNHPQRDAQIRCALVDVVSVRHRVGNSMATGIGR